MADVVDFGFQLGVDHWLEQNSPELAHRSTLSDLAAAAEGLASAGHSLHGAVLFPFPSAPERNYREANERVCRAVLEAGLTPRYPVYAVIPGDVQSVSWLAEALASGQPCLGVKLWPYMGRFSLPAVLDDERLLTLVRDHRLLVMSHVGTGREYRTRPAFPVVRADAAAALELASRLPELDFLFGHLLRLSGRALAKAATLRNVWLDTSGLSTLGRWMEGGVDVLPADDAGDLARATPAAILQRLVSDYGLGDRLVFGSNWPFCTWWKFGVRDEVDLLLQSGLSDQHVERILSVTATALVASHGTGPFRKAREGRPG